MHCVLGMPKFENSTSKRSAYMRRNPREKLNNKCLLPTGKNSGFSLIVLGYFLLVIAGDLN